MLCESSPSWPWLRGSVGWSIVPVTKNVASLIPGQGTCLGWGFNPWTGRVREETDQNFSLTSFSPSLPLLPTLLPLSPKSINISLGVDSKEKEKQTYLQVRVKRKRKSSPSCTFCPSKRHPGELAPFLFTVISGIPNIAMATQRGAPGGLGPLPADPPPHLPAWSPRMAPHPPPLTPRLSPCPANGTERLCDHSEGITSRER